MSEPSPSQTDCINRWLIRHVQREKHQFPVEALIGLRPNLRTYVNHALFIDAEKLCIVQLVQVSPERNTILDVVAARVNVGLDVRGFENLFDGLPGDATASLVGTKNMLAKATLPILALATRILVVG